MIRHLVRQVGVRRSLPPPIYAPPPPRSALMAGALLPTPTTGDEDGARGLRALAPTLRRVRWPPKFKPEMPPRYDGAVDLSQGGGQGSEPPGPRAGAGDRS